ncbi:DivIVA domain-containing protein [uncultured Oscillibacter sp.]|uniref:DivIVA domain-containing protein n=1 Tax=uncultured Oscillibacter sp. TaxID=876091 RepID=UPI00280B2C9D|nr:DivIVA domain-containing protein [uncultured Oscillibacter sp.]
MLTPQEVSTHAFTKAVMGGYNMAMVDEFLDELTDDYTALYKENAALKAKMKVLVEKVEDYRATEDSMRATLLTAQKMADSIVREAEAKRDELLAQAETQAQEKIANLRRQLAEAEDRLRQGQQQLSKFIEDSRAVCAKELAFLEQLPQLPPEQVVSAAEVQDEAREIGETVMAAFAAQQVETPAEPEPQAAAEPAAPAEPEPQAAAESAAPAEPEPEIQHVDYPVGDPFAPQAEEEEETVSEPTRRINLSDLKFGRNYKGDH